MRICTVTVLLMVTMSLATEAPPGRVWLVDRHFVVPEAKASFDVPVSWMKWKQHFAADAEALNKIQTDSTGEWDSAYGPVTDAVLPFKDCVLHVGNDRWGSQSASYYDLQMRVYLTDLDSEAITKAIPAGVEVASKLAAENERGKRGESDSQKTDDWKIDHIQFRLWYHDYGGDANVYFYSRPSGTKTLVLVFMYVERPQADQPKATKDRDAILKSFRMETKKE